MATEIDGTSKGILGAFAAFTLASGLVSLIVGISLLIRNMGVFYNFGQINLFMTSIILIVVGGLLIITIILGVFGALKEISALRMVTLILLFVLLLTLTVVGVWGMITYKTDRLEKSIDSAIRNVTDQTGDVKSEFIQKAKYLNERFNCCIRYNLNDVAGLGLKESCNPPDTEIITEDRVDQKPECISTYFQWKSKNVFRVALVALACVGAVFIALLLYALVFQRARAGYTAVSRG